MLRRQSVRSLRSGPGPCGPGQTMLSRCNSTGTVSIQLLHRHSAQCFTEGHSNRTSCGGGAGRRCVACPTEARASTADATTPAIKRVSWRCSFSVLGVRATSQWLDCRGLQQLGRAEISVEQMPATRRNRSQRCYRALQSFLPALRAQPVPYRGTKTSAHAEHAAYPHRRRRPGNP